MKQNISLLSLPSAFALITAVSIPALGAEATFEKTLRVTGSVQLDIQTDSGSVSVHPGSSDAIVIKGSMRTSGRWSFSNRSPEEALRKLQADPPVEQSGNSIRIGEMIRPEDQKHVSISYEVLVPTETRLQAHSDSGGVTIDGIRGPVEAEADSGSIHISNIGGDVRAQSDSGQVDVDGVQGTLNAQSDSGGIHARGVSGTIDASADSGGIQLQQTAAAPIRANCDSGGITVELASSGYNLSAQTDSGGIDADVPLTVSGRIKRNHVEGKVRGGGPQVTLESDSGNIRIR